MDSQPFSRPRPKSLAQALYDQVAGRIQDGTLRPGDKLATEAELIREHGISRTVVREALSRLQAAGLVETRHGVGTFVLDRPSLPGLGFDANTLRTIHDVLTMLELRICLESEAAGLAATRRSTEQLAGMRRALDAIRHASREDGNAVGEDFQLHLQIAKATGNRYFVELMTYLGAAAIPRYRVDSAQLGGTSRAEYLARINREHEDIYDAIARQDPDGARAAMRAHLTNSRERLRRAHGAADRASSEPPVGVRPRRSH